MKGNCRFDVKCFDGKERMAIMCGGMRKREHGKKDSRVMGIREDLVDAYGEDFLFADGFDAAIIGCAVGSIKITSLQLAGKKRMDTVSFLSGIKLEGGYIL